ncbi:3-hydroxyacyl-CoA dehydrogenase [Pseudomonas sp. MOB-449]|nr:3-hydroxyacyl-CoA dehydrogenase [Pseudomonas sp. MOB-449]
MSNASIQRIGIVGTGAMGRGIAQVAAVAGLSVSLFDARPGAAAEACHTIAGELARQVAKGRITTGQASHAEACLQPVKHLGFLADRQLVVEAIVEDLEAKQALFRDLETHLAGDAILASNTSSLSITTIASACRDPGRVAGLHFFNPVPLMPLVEVIDGLATRPDISQRLVALVKALGHQPVRAKDSPGFIVNHAGRAYGTEALRILAEGVASPALIDSVLRDGAGFPMGPFELLDLIGLDVSLPVMESVYRQYYEEPRYRPHPLLRRMLAAGHLGRKTGQGFHVYAPGARSAPRSLQPVPHGTTLPPIWLSADDDPGRQRLLPLLERLGARVECGDRPSPDALCLLAPLGDDASQATLQRALDPARVVAIDTLADLDRHRCLMPTPLTRPELLSAAHALFARDGVSVSVIRDSAGFIVQRTLAGIVNLACDLAQQGIASVEDIDRAVRLGLGYPQGPLAWGDALGPRRVLRVLERIHALNGDPRYRPSPWLRRRAVLGASLRLPEPTLPA